MFAADEHPFLDAVLARPGDDEPRLVYADFLDETGDPADAARAELIRVQVALARLSLDHSRRPRLIDRQAELLKRHRAAWSAPLADLVAEVGFRRGIPDSVAIDAAAFLARGGELFARTRVGSGRSVVRRVRLLDPARVVPQLALCPFLAEVEELDLFLGDLGNGGLDRLVRSPHLGVLRVLDLGRNGLDDAGVTTLARASTLPRLQALALADNGQITSDGAAALADSPFLAGLLDLDLSGNDVCELGVRAVVRGRAMAQLRALQLAGNHVGDAGVAALVQSPLFARMLAHEPALDLRKNTVGPTGAEALAASPELGRVESLNLDENYLGDRGVIALVGSGRLGTVRSLRLARNQVGDAGAFALVEAALPGLRVLDLSGNRLTNRGVKVVKEAADAGGFVVDLSANGTEPAVPPPVTLDDVVAGVLAAMPGAADVAALRRRVAHPSRPDE